jgi:ABC-type Fe3+/spermidine/putrescine transport system ATPase subunit
MSGGTVDLRAVTKRYGTLAAVDDVTLHVDAGEFVAILGPSGSGKTTTMRLIGGFELPDAGVVEIDGRDVTDVPAARRDVNTVFQSYGLFPHLTVEDNVAYGLRMKGVGKRERRRQAAEALELVQLTDVPGRRPAELSGGMRQRVALARALVNRPSVLLLDEPLGALDRKLREDMQTELRQIQREVGITFVYVTHDQEEALGMADRLVVMRGGRIEQLGVPADVYDHPSSLWVADFVGSSSKLPGVVVGGEPVAVQTDVARVHVGHPHGLGAAGTRAVAIVRPEHVRVSIEEPAVGNRVHARVEELVTVGAQLKVVAVTPGGLRLTARVARTADGSGLPTVGGEAWLAWDADRTHAFPLTGPSAAPADPDPGAPA